MNFFLFILLNLEILIFGHHQDEHHVGVMGSFRLLVFLRKNPNKFDENTYFFIPVDATIDVAINGIFEILPVVYNLKKLAKIWGSFRFYFDNGKWVLKKFISCE